MTKMLVLFTVMLMALCLVGIAGFAAGAPPGVTNLEGTFNVIKKNTTDITTDIAGGGSAIASAVIVHYSGNPTNDKTFAALMDQEHTDSANHVLGGCTCFTFAESSAV